MPPFINSNYDVCYEDDDESSVVGYIFHDLGIEIGVDSKAINAMFFDLQSMDNFVEIKHSHDRSYVLSFFGEPVASGSGFHHPILGDRGPWDRFFYEGIVVHISYLNKFNGIKVLTMFDAASIPE